MRNWLGIVCLITVTSVLASCTNFETCDEMCETRADNCDGGDFDESDCKDACDLFDDAGCDDEMDAVLECVNDMSDYCEEIVEDPEDCVITQDAAGQVHANCSGECDSEGEKLYECLYEYCLANPC